jgi:hypothetical protein
MISTFSLHPTFRDYWGNYDAFAVDELLPVLHDPCYQPKFYKSPETNKEIIPAKGYLPSILQITPGSLIIGYWHNLTTGVGGATGLGAGVGFLVQITDVSLCHKLQSDPVPDYMLGNYNGGFPNLLCAPYPVVGSGQFKVEIWNTTASALRCEIVLGVLEVCPCPL